MIHVSFARIDAIRKDRRMCPNCEARTTFLDWFQHWYGWTTTCLRCGDQWADGEWLPRPFRPGWRKDRVAKARAMWKKYRDVAPREPGSGGGLKALEERGIDLGNA